MLDYVRPVIRDHQIIYTVKATLYADGRGSVQRCKPIDHVPTLELETERLCNFLARHAYRPPEGAPLLPCAAKCWFANFLGSLTACPYQCSVQQLYEAISGSRNQRRQFGGVVLGEYSMDQGQRPAMMQDSSHLAQRVLQKLGYLDEELNSDILEDLRVFVNMSANKRLLRQIGAIPDLQDATTAMQETLRKAFLLSRTDGMWQQAHADGRVREFLLQRGLLRKSAVTSEVFETMQRYVKQESLVHIKTYNGLV